MTIAHTSDTFDITEKIAALHYKWWPVYLVREIRRLRGIQDAMQAEQSVEKQLNELSEQP